LNCPVSNDDIQVIITELNLRKIKWLNLYIYRNPKQNLRYFLDEITKILDFYSSTYDNFIIVGDFNEEITQSDMKHFISLFSLYNLIAQPTCYKSTDGRCIDLILTNKKRSFQRSNSFETGISDYHHLIYTMFRTTYEKSPSQILHYRSFRKFSEEAFRGDLIKALSKIEYGDFDSFITLLESVLDAHAPKKKRTIRGNQKPHLTKTLRKAIMTRSFLKNKANKTGDPFFYKLYKKQRNYIVSLNRKAKESHFHELGTSSDFWKSTKPFFSEGSHAHESVHLFDEHGNVSKNNDVISHIFNTYFVNITENLNLSPWETCPNIEGEQNELDDIELILRKYHNHPSIKSVKRLNSVGNFSFKDVTSVQVYQALLNLDPHKSVSGTIPTKVIRMVADTIAIPIAQCINVALISSYFPQALKLAEISPIFKRGDKFLKEN